MVQNHSFIAELDIIGINPFVFVPERILEQIFAEAEKDKGHIPVCGQINEKSYTQTLLKYKGSWRLYVNTTMLSNSPQRIGEILNISIALDKQDRTIPIHPKLKQALYENLEAKNVFESLSASKQKEIIRYISNLKTEQSVSKNIQKAIGFLMGKNNFAGRNKP